MQPSVEHSLSEMVQAWDRGDAHAYAEQFTADATYVIFTGSVSRGRDEIARDHEAVLTRYQRGSRMRIEVIDIRHLTDDVAVVLSEGGVGKGRLVALDKVQTFVFRRQPDDRWLCEAFQNTKKNRLMTWLAGRRRSGQSS